jgi:hypothetical protein
MHTHSWPVILLESENLRWIAAPANGLDRMSMTFVACEKHVQKLYRSLHTCCCAPQRGDCLRRGREAGTPYDACSWKQQKQGSSGRKPPRVHRTHSHPPCQATSSESRLLPKHFRARRLSPPVFVAYVVMSRGKRLVRKRRCAWWWVAERRDADPGARAPVSIASDSPRRSPRDGRRC